MPLLLKPAAWSLTPSLIFLCALTIGRFAQAEEAPQPPQPPAPPAPPPSDNLPDPTTWRQEPPPVLDKPRPIGPHRIIEIGLSGGATSRPAESTVIKYGLSPTVGMHARVDLLKWLGFRIAARWERVPVSFDPAALGLPPGTTYDQSGLHRISLYATIEPTYYPTPTLALFIGLGLGWGRTTADPLHTSGAEEISLPIRSAVFAEFPITFGVRYEVVKDWLVVNAAGHTGFIWDQSGALVNPYVTPGKTGNLVTVTGFPELSTSYGFLAGVGCLL